MSAESAYQGPWMASFRGIFSFLSSYVTDTLLLEVSG